MNPKSELRRDMASKRQSLNPQWVETVSTQIAESLLSMEVFQAAETVALYMAIAGEVKLDTLFEKCWNLGKRTCIPVFNTAAKIYDIATITPETDYKTGHYGIREPIAPFLCSKNEIDLIIVPGVAFDRKGNRLGRGGGYYDRLLEGTSGASVAVAFDFQILPDIPVEPHDRPVDALVTETEIVNAL